MIADWMPEKGNYFISSGTWLVDRLIDRTGVIREIGDMHESGTVVIHWKYNSTEYLSAPSFRSKLMRGRYAIDHDQHPYNKKMPHWEPSD